MFIKALLVLGIFFFNHLSYADPNKDLPYRKEIMKIMDPLVYSGFQDLVKPEVDLKIDFEKRIWMLKNIYKYDMNSIVIQQGYYGLCAELAVYVFDRLHPQLTDPYDLKFVTVTEGGFFQTDQSNHIALLLIDSSTKNSYIIDPSFHKYGNVADMKEYKILAVKDVLSFMQNKSRDFLFQVDKAMPLFFKDDLLVSFSITSVEGVFDKNNFLFVIGVDHLNNKTNSTIIALGKHKSQVKSYVDKTSLLQIFSTDEVDKLVYKLDDWIKQVED